MGSECHPQNVLRWWGMCSSDLRLGKCLGKSGEKTKKKKLFSVTEELRKRDKELFFVNFHVKSAEIICNSVSFPKACQILIRSVQLLLGFRLAVSFLETGVALAPRLQKLLSSVLCPHLFSLVWRWLSATAMLGCLPAPHSFSETHLLCDSLSSSLLQLQCP